MVSNIVAPRIAVHIGLAKTGTSSLQRLVFARHPEIANFGGELTEYRRNVNQARPDDYGTYLQDRGRASDRFAADGGEPTDIRSRTHALRDAVP